MIPRSGGVAGEGAAGASELVVEVDAGAEREQADGDSGAQVGVCSGAVSFEAEEVFAGLEDAFDALSDIESRRVVVGRPPR